MDHSDISVDLRGAGYQTRRVTCYTANPDMPAVQLDPLNEAKKEEVLALELEDFQLGFLPDVASSIEMATKYPSAKCLVIRDQAATAVGFALYGIDEVTGEWKIFRLMIDKNHQGHGLGKAALEKMCDELRTVHSAASILVVFHEHNLPARRLYEGFGFQEYAREGTKVLARWSESAV